MERTAFFRAVYDGEREFTKIVVVGGMERADGNAVCAPSSVCRQVMMEFCNPKTFKIVLADGVYLRRAAAWNNNVCPYCGDKIRVEL